MMVLKLITIDMTFFQKESLLVGDDKLDESTLSFHRKKIRLRKSSVLIMPLECCVKWNAKTANKLVVEMESRNPSTLGTTAD